MKPKQLLILGIIFCVLFFGVLVKQLQKPPELVTEEFVSLDLSFADEMVRGIEIFKGIKEEGDEGVRLEIADAGWRVTSLWNARADKGKVDDFLSEIRDAKGEIRGKDASLFPDFGIGDEDAFHVKLMDGSGKELLYLLIGTNKVDHQSLFVREKDSVFVFLTVANLFGEMGVYGKPENEQPKSDYWASTQLINVDEETLTRIENVRFEDSKGTVTASVGLETDPYDSTKKEWKFQRPEVPFPASGDKVKQFLRSFKGWKAQRVLDPSAKGEELASPIWRMTVWTEGNEEPIVVMAGEKDETTKAHPIKVSTEPVVYQLSQYYFENMDIDDSKFFADNPLQITLETTEKLVIRSGRQELSFEPKVKTWSALSDYINELKRFRVIRLLFDPEEREDAKSPGKNWIELQAEGLPPQILDVAEKKKDMKEIPAVMRGTAHPFLISDSTYEKLFEDLDSLKEPD